MTTRALAPVFVQLTHTHTPRASPASVGFCRWRWPERMCTWPGELGAAASGYSLRSLGPTTPSIHNASTVCVCVCLVYLLHRSFKILGQTKWRHFSLKHSFKVKVISYDG